MTDIDQIKKWLHLTYIAPFGSIRFVEMGDGYLGRAHSDLSDIVAVLKPNKLVFILQEAIENLKRKINEIEDEERKFETWAEIKELEKALEVTKEFIEKYEQSKKKWESSTLGKLFKKLGIE